MWYRLAALIGAGGMLAIVFLTWDRLPIGLAIVMVIIALWVIRDAVFRRNTDESQQS
jgi:hypothetical protein